MRAPAHYVRGHLVGRAFLRQLAGATPRDAIAELVRALVAGTSLDAERVTQALVAREQVMPTGLDRELAVPNVRVDGITAPLVGLGVSRAGIDFNAPDGSAAKLVFVMLLPREDHDAQWDLLQDIARTFAAPEARARALEAASYTELLATLNWGERHDGDPTADGPPRDGALIVGAGPTARAIAAKLVEAGSKVWLVDSNRDHCAAATQAGLTIVQGNALRDVVLFQGHAFDARSLLALTPNAEVNAAVAAFARTEFRIPDVHALATSTGVPVPPDQGLFRGPIDLRQWDAWLQDGVASWSSAVVTAPSTVAEHSGRESREPAQASVSGRIARADAPPIPARAILPVLVVRGAERLIASPALALLPGDVVTSLRGPRDDVVRDRFDRVIEAAVVLDLDRPLGGDAFAKLAADELSKRTALTAAELARRLGERLVSTTLLTPWLAVTRILVPGTDVYEALVARCKPGIAISSSGEVQLRALFVLAGSEDTRIVHLQALAAIAHLLQEPGFEERWTEAASAGALKRLILESDRPRKE